MTWDSLTPEEQVKLLYELGERVLTDTQWRRFHLHYFEGFDIATLADMEQVTETAIRKSLDGSVLKVRKAREVKEAA